jgi:hypothetical protein
MKEDLRTILCLSSLFFDFPLTVWRLSVRPARSLPRPPLPAHPYSVTLTRSSISNYDSRYRDPNRDRDRNRRESKEFDPDSDFDFDCTDVP